MKFRSAIVCLTAVLAGASLAGAATLNVGPAQTYTTLQSAVNAAVDGDTILVDPGTYLGKSATMYIDGKSNLLIKANGGPVILDQDGRANSVSGKGICNVVGSSTNVAFEGLTFVNAQVRDNDSGYNAAAIAWEGAGLLRVSNCVIHDCEMALRVFFAKGTDMLFENSVIYNCGGTASKATIGADVVEGAINNFTMQYCWVYNGKADLIRVRARTMKFLYNRLGDEYVDGAWGPGAGYILKLDGGGLAYVIGNLITKGGGSSNSQVCVYGGSSMYGSYSNLSYWLNNTFLNERIAGTSTTISMGGGQPPYVANNIWIHFNNANDTFCSMAGFRPSGNTSNVLVFDNQGVGTSNPAINMVNYLTTAPVDVHLLAGSAALGVGLVPGGGVLPATGSDSVRPELGTFSLAAAKHYVHPTTVGGLPGSENRNNWADAGMYALAANNNPSINQAPIVFAGASAAPAGVTAYPNRPVVQNGGMLMGAASDDGLPAGSSLSYTWSKVSGPGTVVFASVNNPVTSATFSASGVYVLQLAASDGALTSTSTTTVWAEMPPTVNAGSDQTVALNATVNLAGTASDDNLPAGSALAYTWRTVTVPTGATVAFGTGTALSTTATGFTVAGNYVLALDVSDTVFTTRDTVTITVGSPNTPPTVTAGAVPAFVYETWPVNLTCTASDPDAGDVLTYAWTQTAGKTVSLSGAATPGASFTVPSLTLFVDSPMAFQIAVTDGKSPAVMASMTVNAYMMGDITHDGYVNVGDLQGLVAAWGGHASGLAADINGDTYVNVGDLQNLVANWGRSLH